MKSEFESQISEAVDRIKNGATPKKLLEEYSSLYQIHEAFFIVAQAQIIVKENNLSKVM